MSAKAILSASVSAAPVYVEDVFSTFLYTSTGAAQTITNGIDLAGEGGLVWGKDRVNAYDHYLFDTVRGLPTSNQALSSNTTGATGYSDVVQSFTSSGFTGTAGNNRSNASWTFRKQPKFFDVVTYTGTGSNTTIAHNLGSVPGAIWVKRTDTTGDWQCYHRSLANTQYMVLNSTAAVATGATRWNSTTPTSSVFSLGTDASVNASGGTYVAYLFAHDAGGFGDAGTDNVISCGSFTTDGSGNATVSLGYEPQWVLIKPTNEVNSWVIVDTMRGYSLGAGDVGEDARLRPNTSDAESNTSNVGYPTATGFYVAGSGSMNHIYIAIRRGPMKVPTVGTEVFNGIARTGNGTATTVSNSGFTPDTVLSAPRTAGPSYGLAFFFDRLRGPTYLLETRSSQATQTGTTTLTGFDTMNGYIVGVDASGYGAINANAVTYINWNFRRAPGFFDVVCYRPPSSAVNTYAHNLGAIPELMIIKTRDSARRWVVYTQPTGNTQALHLNTADAVNSTGNNYFNSTSPTASVFTLDNGFGDVCNGGGLGVAYLFATCPGVSKVGSYTGNGTTQTINCGFTSGARFVLIKRTDSTGGWYVYDTARGMTVLTDPYLFLNDAAVEVATLGSVTTVSTGFALNSTILADINISAGSYIFLAIA